MPPRETIMATPSPEIVDAVGKLLRADPARRITVARNLRAPGRSFESTVTGTSMGSGLGPGSRIRVALVHRDRYEAREVVAFVSGDQVIVHRVAHRGRAGRALGYFITVGDATLVPDPPVDHGRILGSVTGVWFAGGWVPPRDPPRRSLRATVARSLSLTVAVGALYVSPRFTASALTHLHRVVGALRAAVVRRGQRRAPGPARPPGGCPRRPQPEEPVDGNDGDRLVRQLRDK